MQDKQSDMMDKLTAAATVEGGSMATDQISNTLNQVRSVAETQKMTYETMENMK